MPASSDIFQLAEELFPICRSLTGDGVRQTLEILMRELPGLQSHEVPSGTQCFDWTIPDEWNIRDAYIIGPSGEKVVDFAESNLHVVHYSTPVDTVISLDELQEHLYSLPEMPDAIPYVTSYYERRWGFCLADSKRRELVAGDYRVVIDSTLEPGFLTSGELVIEGRTDEEVMFSTYICHPSMANNELSGPLVACYLAKWIDSLPDRKYTYRFLFNPETIGAISYLSRDEDRLDHLKRKVVAGFNLSCVGDTRCYSYLPSRKGDTLADRTALHVLKSMGHEFIRYSFLDRGSDERQYCSPGIDLPVCSILRSKFGTYPEYHTSLDNLDLISREGLEQTLECYQRCVTVIENNQTLEVTTPCEPQLGKRQLYPTLSKVGSARNTAAMMDLLAYADGKVDLLEICEIIGVPLWELVDTVDLLMKHDLLRRIDG